MMDLLTLFDTVGSASDLCDSMAPGLRIVGIVVLGIRIAVPIILIVVGMLDLAKAVTEKSEDNIKKAQQGLIKKAIAAGLVFLVTFLVDVVMLVVGTGDYKECKPCITSPFGADCKQLVEDATGD